MNPEHDFSGFLLYAGTLIASLSTFGIAYLAWKGNRTEKAQKHNTELPRQDVAQLSQPLRRTSLR